jgi:hypothetical protein
VLADQNPDLALELYRTLGIVRLGRVSGQKPARELIPRDYVPQPRPDELTSQPRSRTGALRRERLLAIPGTVFVKPGEQARTDTLVARSTRQFLRPFFLHVAEAIEVPPAELEQHLLKRVGDVIRLEDVIAQRRRRLSGEKKFHSPVAGRIEKLLPGGVVLVRELPEEAREYTAVPVAKEMGIEPDKLAPYLRVQPGQEVEVGQWLAANLNLSELRHVDSPVRGKVSRIDKHFGIVLIEPLLEETAVHAWLPGTVESVSDRGCVVVGNGTELLGVWGSGGETAGELTTTGIAAGKIAVIEFASTQAVVEAREKKAAGLICAGVNLFDVLEPSPPFTLVVMNGFGEQRFDDGVRELLAAHEGKLCLLDGTTQLRVGVRRPCIILPES